MLVFQLADFQRQGEGFAAQFLQPLSRVGDQGRQLKAVPGAAPEHRSRPLHVLPASNGIIIQYSLAQRERYNKKKRTLTYLALLFAFANLYYKYT